ncbi:hypothetical protein [Hymenobacter psoromatis]|uniref:hypothetical protein n=1 Tax=Hymenobacter psoromatis TaxID=1484116 RepID=UPI001CBF6218|nr:hypothetical protein [Hymenobacter psoromatis]
MRQITEQIGGYTFKIYLHQEHDTDIKLILEGTTKGMPLGGTYSFIKHQPHNSTGEYHIHVYDDSNEILAINQGGTGHDGYHGTRIPNKVYRALVAKFPNWKFPSNQIVESTDYVTAFDFRHQTLRPVRVMKHTMSDSIVESFEGFFHRFADEPFLVGGTGGYFAKTIAIVESMDGNIRKIAVDRFRFTDVNY